MNYVYAVRGRFTNKPWVVLSYWTSTARAQEAVKRYRRQGSIADDLDIVKYKVNSDAFHP